MIMAVFMAMIAIGALYYLVGLGDAILAQERMQDAADATAFSSAVIHARGMNLLALINIIMASLLAILVLLAMLASLLNLAAAVVAGIAIIWGFAAPAVPPLRTAAKVASKAENEVKTKVVQRLMETLHKAQEPLRRAIPVMAASNAITLSGRYQPVVTAAITFPILEGLPTVEGKFDTLCTKAGEYAGQIAAAPAKGLLAGISAIPGMPPRVVNRVRDIVVGMAETTSETYASFYCGSGPKPKPPSTTTNVSIPKLNTSDMRKCDKNDQDACERYSEELKEVEAAYDEELGRCTGSGESKRLCVQRRRRARNECKPGTSGKTVKIKWREIDKTRHFQLVGEGYNKRVVEGESTEDGAGHFEEEENPNPSSFPISCRVPLNSSFGNTDMTLWDHDLDDPICQTDIDVPTVEEFAREKTNSIDRPIREFTDILWCIKEKTVEAEFGDANADDLKDSKPQEMCNCAAQGESMFQIRSIVLGDPTEYTADSSKKILVATGGRAVEQGLLSELGELGGNFAAAQAEFYFDDASAKKETWLWSMNWKARMRRLYFARKAWECPEEENTCTGEKPDSGTGSSTASSDRLKGIKGKLGAYLDSIIVH